DVLAAGPQTRALLTVERPGRGPTAAAGGPLALAVRPGPPEAPGSVLCLAGPKGTGKSSLAEAVARALGRTHVHATLEGANVERLIRGSEYGAAGRIVEGLCEAGVNNPVFILEAVDRVEPDAAGALLYLLDPARRNAFRDAYLDVAFDLSAVRGSSRRPIRARSPSRCASTSRWSSCQPAPRRRSWPSRNSTC
ncbi:MAG: AAA family ATPase, partial [Acidobacteria bacterium]|nr:AAA family ATPase [Acidobacteriota bacterium]